MLIMLIQDDDIVKKGACVSLTSAWHTGRGWYKISTVPMDAIERAGGSRI